MSENRVSYSKQELVARLEVSRDSVDRRIREGKAKNHYFGRRVLIPASELARLMAEAK
jgi:excisionase family DNA binding protein